MNKYDFPHEKPLNAGQQGKIAPRQEANFHRQCNSNRGPQPFGPLFCASAIRRWGIITRMSVTLIRPNSEATIPQKGSRPESESGSSLYRWSSDEYHRLIELGFFDDVRVELLDGEIWRMPAQLTPHATSVRKATFIIRAAFGEGFIVEAQLPTTLNNGSEPEPDVLVVPGTPDDYIDHHPGPDDVRLLVEVSDKTLRKDRTRKALAYARAGIEDYWIVNLVDRQLEVHRGPAPDGYQTVAVYAPGQSLTPLHAPQSSVTVADLLPPVSNS